MVPEYATNIYNAGFWTFIQMCVFITIIQAGPLL